TAARRTGVRSRHSSCQRRSGQQLPVPLPPCRAGDLLCGGAGRLPPPPSAASPLHIDVAVHDLPAELGDDCRLCAIPHRAATRDVGTSRGTANEVLVTMETSKDHATQLALDRTLLAHERTMMAWVRTAVSLITFGFSIYKFFELELKITEARRPHQLIDARTFALMMIVIGLAALSMASIQ